MNIEKANSQGDVSKLVAKLPPIILIVYSPERIKYLLILALRQRVRKVIRKYINKILKKENPTIKPIICPEINNNNPPIDPKLKDNSPDANGLYIF